MTERDPSAQPRLRRDLLVMPDGETGRGRVVKDPRRRKYFRFDELEGAILELLDGRHTPVDIQVELASRFGEEFSLEEIQEFIDTLRDKDLVEGGGPKLPACAPALGRQVVAALEAGGFRFRSADEPPPPGTAVVRRPPEEARKFDEAAALLRAGRFAAALRAFDEILAANPNNRRAAAIRQLLLQTGAAHEQARERTARKRRRSALYYQIPLLDPDRWFGAVEPALRFVWTRGFAVVYGLVLAAAGLVAVRHAAEIGAAMPDLGRAGAAGALLVTLLALTAVHESAHGLTCKHYGGKVPELGILLILFFLPAVYVDVSDAWLFRDRRRRALVGLAGPLWDLLAAALALLAWRLLPPGPAETAALTVVAASGFSFLLNLNPLMRLDGYYVLSDLSGVPNLRIEALRFVLGGFGLRAAGRAPRKPRTRLFLALYGLLSAAYILAILGILLRGAGAVAARMAGLWGPAALAAFALYLLRRPLRSAGSALGRRLAAAGGRGFAGVAAAAAALGAAGLVPLTLKVSGPATLEAATRVAVRAEEPGNLARLLVREGDEVRAGQLVAQLDPAGIEAQLEVTRAEIERARAELALLERGPQKEQVQQARERVRAAKAEVEHLRSRVARLARLRSEGLVAADQFEQVSKELAVREGALRSALEQARLLEKGPRPEEIQARRAEVERLEAKQRDLERRKAALDLRAPVSGVVVTSDLSERLGERIPAGGVLLEIADPSRLRAEVMVLEAEIGDVRVGQEVQLRFTAFPGRRFRGVVEEIAPVAERDALGRAAFRVRCRVEDPDGLLRPGMTGAAKIVAGRMPAARLLVRRLLRLVDVSLL
ncbi:MAG: HlyD family efflux transporter periplasmic adaptor subunit [Acidobacteria bacterium]|nr:MAG: HlyD family efflux transporter periplasmic adaptor subunit [Acidobacteriota bacterium]